MLPKIKWFLVTAAALIMFIGQCSAVISNDLYVEATGSSKNEISATYFGMHFHRLTLNQGEKGSLTKWPEQLIGSIRLWDSRVRWADISPRAGQWNFERMDTYVEQAVINNTDILYVLGSTPRWVSVRPDEQCPYGMGCAAEPIRMAHWEEYVRRVAQRYKGKISTYELWNEPFFSELKKQKGKSDFYYGSVSQMVEMARIARKVLDEVDPKAVLTTPGFTGPTNQLELFLSSGGKQYVQAIAYHFYASDVVQFGNQLLEVRAIMARQGLSQLPLLNTETGVEVYINRPLPTGVKDLTRTEAAVRMAQFLIMGAAAGLERYYYYAWDNPNSGMSSSPSVRFPAWDAYEKIYGWLLGAKMLGCKPIPPSGLRCQGEVSGQQFLIVWAEKEAIHAIPVPDGQRAVSVEKLFSTRPQVIGGRDRSLKLKLGNEPVRILLEAHS